MNNAWLILETSGRGGTVGLAVDDRPIRELSLDPERRHNRDLAPAAKLLIGEAGLTPSQLAGVMVGIGPGSFTGLRVGIMSAKALAWAVDCQLVAVPTFAAIAERAPAHVERLELLADALQGQAYRQRYERINGQWQPADTLRIEPATVWAEDFDKDDSAFASGPGLDQFAKLVTAEARKRLLPEETRRPTVESLFRVGRQLPALSMEGLLKLEPLYLRGSSAEEKAAKG